MRWGGLLLLAGCAGLGPLVDSGEREAPPRSYTLDDPIYRFCHDAGADAAEVATWCPVLEHVPADRCPGLRETCKHPAPPRQVSPLGCGAGAPTGPTSTPMGAPEGGPPPSPPPKLSDWLVRVLRWVGAAMVALLVLAVMSGVVAALRRRRRGEVPPVAVAHADADAQPLERVSADAVPDVPGEELLTAAERAVDEGRFDDAVLLARAAALRSLGDAGKVRLHRARTDREYVRALRREETLHGPLAVVVGAVEWLRWGGRGSDAPRARAVVSAARGLVATLGVALLLVVTLGADADLRYGAAGDAAIADLYTGAGYDVSYRLRSFRDIADADVDVLLLDLWSVAPSDDDWDALRAWVADGRVLVVAGETANDVFSELGERVPAAVKRRGEAGVAGPVLPGGAAWAWRGSAGDAVVWGVPGGDAEVVRLTAGRGVVYALSDPRLLWNGALLVPENEALLLHLIDAERGGILDDDPAQTRLQLALFSAAGGGTPAGATFNAHLLPMMLQMIVTAGLGALWLGWPLGPLRDPPETERQHFREHVEALGGRVRRAKGAGWARASYAKWAVGRYGVAGLRGAAVRGGHTPAEASALVARVQASADRTSAGTRDLEDMEDLWKILHP